MYVDSSRENLAEISDLKMPLAHLTQAQLRPSKESLEKILAGMF